MKTEKLSLKSIKNVLSRAEMKQIMAGSGGGCGCDVDSQCVMCFGVDYHCVGENPLYPGQGSCAQY